MNATEFAALPVYRQRAILQGRVRRLSNDLARYGALFPSPLILRQIEAWKIELETALAALLHLPS